MPSSAVVMFRVLLWKIALYVMAIEKQAHMQFVHNFTLPIRSANKKEQCFIISY